MNKAPPRQQDQRETLLRKVILLPFKVAGLIFLGLIFSILVEWVGMTFFWPEKGASHAKSMMESEISYLEKDIGTWVTGVKPSTYAEKIQSKTHKFLLSDLKLSKVTNYFRTRARWIFNYLAAMIFTIETFLIRLLVATLSLPAFLIIGVIGVVEGLVQRDIRRFGGGIEHAFTYHLVKRNLKWPIILSWFLYLSLPISIHPNWVFIPATISFGGGLMMVTSTFKKYL